MNLMKPIKPSVIGLKLKGSNYHGRYSSYASVLLSDGVELIVDEKDAVGTFAVLKSVEHKADTKEFRKKLDNLHSIC